MGLNRKSNETLAGVVASRSLFNLAPCRAVHDETLVQLDRLGEKSRILRPDTTVNGAALGSPKCEV